VASTKYSDDQQLGDVERDDVLGLLVVGGLHRGECEPLASPASSCASLLSSCCRGGAVGPADNHDHSAMF
jgi:hypothetical protein